MASHLTQRLEDGTRDRQKNMNLKPAALRAVQRPTSCAELAPTKAFLNADAESSRVLHQRPCRSGHTGGSAPPTARPRRSRMPIPQVFGLDEKWRWPQSRHQNIQSNGRNEGKSPCDCTVGLYKRTPYTRRVQGLCDSLRVAPCSLEHPDRKPELATLVT